MLSILIKTQKKQYKQCSKQRCGAGGDGEHQLVELVAGVVGGGGRHGGGRGDGGLGAALAGVAGGGGVESHVLLQLQVELAHAEHGEAGDLCLDEEHGQPVADLVGEGHEAVDEGSALHPVPDEVSREAEAGDQQDTAAAAWRGQVVRSLEDGLITHR